MKSAHKGSSAEHSALVNEVAIALCKLSFIRIEKRVVGTFFQVRHDANGKVVSAQPFKIGTEGEPDLRGTLTRWDGAGLDLGVECKTGNATQSEEQKSYELRMKRMGAIYFVVRSVEEALQLANAERMKGKP